MSGNLIKWTQTGNFLAGKFKSWYYQKSEYRIIFFIYFYFDRNGILKKREFGAFRRTVKRISRNKVCARHFWKYCDQRSDGRLTRSEWTQCLGLDTNSKYTNQKSLLNCIFLKLSNLKIVVVYFLFSTFHGLYVLKF